MRHLFIYLVASVCFFSCDNNKKQAKKESQPVESAPAQNSKIGRSNYAVVWNWTTTDEQLVTDNAATISEELSALWQKGIVENAYYNSNSKVDKLSYFPNISFSLKAESYKAAEVILNNLTVVKKGIAVYKMYPTGTLWLDRKADAIDKNGMTKSYVTVWTTKKKPTDESTREQADIILKLWEAGTIENVYFDIEGTQKPNNKTDFVFYANANSEAEAKAICESLPFSKEDIATYKVREVGMFWMGKFEQD